MGFVSHTAWWEHLVINDMIVSFRPYCFKWSTTRISWHTFNKKKLRASIENNWRNKKSTKRILKKLITQKKKEHKNAILLCTYSITWFDHNQNCDLYKDDSTGVFAKFFTSQSFQIHIACDWLESPLRIIFNLNFLWICLVHVPFESLPNHVNNKLSVVFLR